jgi:hypothetical protein
MHLIVTTLSGGKGVKWQRGLDSSSWITNPEDEIDASPLFLMKRMRSNGQASNS